MGLAASQVRLLQLTSRQHRIEYNAQKIQAQKLQLANESDMVYNAYMRALDAKKVQFKYIETDGSISYRDANFMNMVGNGFNSEVQNQYAIEIISNDEFNGKFYVPASIPKGETETVSIKTEFEKAIKNTTITLPANIDDLTLGKIAGEEVNDTNRATLKNGTYTADQILSGMFDVDITDLNRDEYVGKYQAKYFANAVATDPKDASEMAYYENMYNLFYKAGANSLIVYDNAKYQESYEWLTNKLANGELLLHKWETEGGNDGKGAWAEVSVSTDTMLQEVADEKEVKKAEATYEAETTRINRKDAQYDTLLSQTETERNAIKTEMDSLKSVRNDNIDKAFKLFS